MTLEGLEGPVTQTPDNWSKMSELSAREKVFLNRLSAKFTDSRLILRKKFEMFAEKWPKI